MPQASEGEENTQKSPSAHKCKKVSIISSANTVIDPHAMMILGLYAIITSSAMVTSRWSPNVTGFAVLGRNVHGGVSRFCRSNHGPLSRRRT